MKNRQRISNQMIHISDWLPTFAKVAGVDVTGQIDGKNVWTALSRDLTSPRHEILNHHDSAVPYMALIKGNYKYISGSTYDGFYDKWLSDTSEPDEENRYFADHYAQMILASDAGQALKQFSFTKTKHNSTDKITDEEINKLRARAKITCNGYKIPVNNSIESCIESPCLFDIEDDPCETTNIADKYPSIFEDLKQRAEYYGRISKPMRNKPGDERANPQHFDGVWTWWYDELNIETKSSGESLSMHQNMIIFIFICTVLLNYFCN